MAEEVLRQLKAWLEKREAHFDEQLESFGDIEASNWLDGFTTGRLVSFEEVSAFLAELEEEEMQRMASAMPEESGEGAA